jgi:MurNAc alpha-1-phosphate uridylyltransferase
MLMAAGLGKRMRPLTDTMPKPLVAVAGVSLIDRALNWLDASGVASVVVNSHYKADMLVSHLRKRSSPVLSFSHEDVLLETGGGIKKALPMLGKQPFFVINSDVICLDGNKPALQRLLDAWNDKTMDALLLLHPLERAVGFYGEGDFSIGSDGAVVRRGRQAYAPYVYTGIQLLHPRIFKDSPEGAFSLNLLYDRDIARIHAVVHDGEWLHVGDPQGLADAEAFLSTR